MHEQLAVILLGIIEGITEFLPISSTGHLLIAQHWLGRRSDLFNVAIQAGAILAVVLIFRERLSQFARWRSPADRDYLVKLVASVGVTVVGGLIAKLAGLELPETVAPIAWTLIIGGVAILVIESYAGRRELRTDLTWTIALWVGVGQILAAVFPGTSRSAATIFAAMLAGMARVPATEFSFLVGIPTMFAATGYELIDLGRSDGFESEDWSALAVGFIVSAVVAFIVVKWLLRYVQTHRFTVFAWYRIGFGALLLTMDI